MIDWLRNLILPPTPQSLLLRPPPLGSYPIFTSEFDLTIHVDQYLENLGLSDALVRRNLAATAKETLEIAAKHIFAALRTAVDDLARVGTVVDAGARADTAVSLLVDHSGSLRGAGQVHALAIVQAIARFLHDLNIRFEVLGFTTCSWRGGRSREKWLRAGKPQYPGRLCDLFHIIYRSFEDKTRHAHVDMSLLCSEQFLKENVDGEAVQWAYDRLLNQPQSKKLLFAITDGAPVDDSTLNANWDSILHDHLIKTVRLIEEERKVLISGIGIKHEWPYYSASVTLTTMNDLAPIVLRHVADRLCEAHTNPPPPQG